jgi:hypothetical protein
MKVGVGHNLIHLAFFIAMLTINQDITMNLHDGKKPKPDDHRLLAAAAPKTDEYVDPQKVKEHELLIFHILIATHAVCFIFQNIILALKKYHWVNTA